ncbi:MAG: hypothetical protein M3Y53_09505 [Thermoproteota archaeon]|nr:hypothetical protein [Thermoproteota archaeon]
MLISYLLVKRVFLFSAVGVGIAVVTVFLLFSVFAVATQDYAISVDPIKDNQYLFSTARVTITNTGKLPLTNIVVNYGGKVDKLTSLSPGENAMLSPPENSTLKSVTVTADHGLNVTKDYRTPLKIPGMMGS